MTVEKIFVVRRMVHESFGAGFRPQSQIFCQCAALLGTTVFIATIAPLDPYHTTPSFLSQEQEQQHQQATSCDSNHHRQRYRDGLSIEFACRYCRLILNTARWRQIPA